MHSVCWLSYHFSSPDPPPPDRISYWSGPLRLTRLGGWHWASGVFCLSPGARITGCATMTGFYCCCSRDWIQVLMVVRQSPRAQEFLTKIKCSSRTSYLLCFLSLICALNPTLRLYEPFSSSIVEGFLTLRNLILLETYNSFKDVFSL